MRRKIHCNITKNILIFICFFSLLASCSYQDRVQPIILPTAAGNTVKINGLYVSAVAYEDAKIAKEAFGFDIRKAGLLPVELTFQNEGKKIVKLIPGQTFLIDSKNQAWPINSQERTYKRIERYVDIGEAISGTGKPALLLGAAGAVAGLAVGIVTGENAGESIGKGAAIGAAAGAVGGGAYSYLNAKNKIQGDLKTKSLKNRQILPNQIAYGILFFPGLTEEAQDAKKLKLTLSFDGDIQSVDIDIASHMNDIHQ